jgi:hypothetical protein
MGISGYRQDNPDYSGLSFASFQFVLFRVEVIRCDRILE